MRKLFILSLLAMMIAIGGCGSGGTSADPLGTDGMMFGHKEDAAGTDWSTAMTVGPRGTVILTAKVKNASGAAVVGREVTFGFASNVSGATLSTTRATTDATGEAMTLYTAGMFAGFDVVRASISNGATLDTNITVDDGGGVSTYAVSIAASTETTPVTAGQVSIITATVTSISGSTSAPVGGVTVTFALPVNNSGASFIDSSGASVLALSAITDGAGNAVVAYTAGVSNPTLTVVDVVEAVLDNGVTGSIIITRTTSAVSIIVGAEPLILASNAASSVVTATVTDNRGTGVSGVTVNFTVEAVLAPDVAGTLSVASATTDGSGNAVTTFTGGGVSRATNDTDAVKASITVGGNTYTYAVVITYP